MSTGVKVVVCGSITNASTKFAEAIADEWLADNWVICPVLDMRRSAADHTNRGKRLIEEADEVLVVVVDGYIDSDTQNGIAHAEHHNKTIRYRLFTTTRAAT